MRETTTDAKRLLRLEAVGERLDLSTSQVYRLVQSGKLPAVQLGGRGSSLRVDERELERFIYGPQEAA